MAKGIWGALTRLGRGNRKAEKPTEPPTAAPASDEPVVTARMTRTASGRPHLVARKRRPGKATAKAVEKLDPKGSEKVKAIRMRTKSPRVNGRGKKRDLVRRRRALAKGSLEVVARKEEALTVMRSSFRELGGALREIHTALREDQTRSQAVAEKLHRVPEILAALPAIAERQQVCLDRMADRTEALAVIPRALAAVHDHAKAQIATLSAIRESLERGTQNQIDAIRGLGDGQRSLVDGVKELGQATAEQMQKQSDELWHRVNERDRQRRNRLLAIAAGLGVGLAALGAVAAHAGASTLRSMQRSSSLLAETATRDMERVRGELQTVGDLERRIAEREDELRLLLSAARSELARSRTANARGQASREAELDQLKREIATLRGKRKTLVDTKAPSGPTVRE